VRKYDASQPQILRSNYSLAFDGASGTVEVANPSNFNFDAAQAFSLSAWIETSATSGEQAIASKLNPSTSTGWQWITNGGVLELDMENGTHVLSVVGSTNVADGTWHQVVMTYDGSGTAAGVQFYVDGAADTMTTASDTLGGNTIRNSQPLYLGSVNNAGAFWNGNEADVRFYTSQLTSQDAVNLAEGSEASVFPYAHWLFAEGSGSITADAGTGLVPTSAGLTSSATTVSYGSLVTFTVTVTPTASGTGTPTGTVVFLDGGATLGSATLSSGTATFSTSSLTAGSQTLTAAYGGDGSFSGGTSNSLVQIVS